MMRICKGAIYRALDNNRAQNIVTNGGAINRAPTGGFAGDKNPMLHNNLSRLIRWFECRKNVPHFAWQRNFWEHIRDAADYARIDDYITKPPNCARMSYCTILL
ncbi:MAG: hypothetical protein LBD45_08545 [Bacteroidales bacterium]|jgi:hypothetical protein|nr:hypothetical protein [Bacteroidales bacterium]